MEPKYIRQLIRPDLIDIKPYSSARDEYSETSRGMTFLDANESPVENGLNRYPDPFQRAVKEKLADKKGVAVNQIFLGNGSDEVLDLLFRAFCIPGMDNCLILPPTYGMYSVLSAINGVERREVQLTSNFQPDVSGIVRSTDQHSKLLFICSPNNPTGNLMDETVVEQLLSQFPGLVVIDEAYWDFGDSESWVQKLDSYPNLVVTQTFSKAFGLAGIRLGACYADPAVIAILNAIKPPYNVNELTQQTVLKELENTKTIEDRIRDIKSEKLRLIQRLNAISFVDEVFPSDANFVLVRVDYANRRYSELLDKGIVVRNRSGQPLCDNCLRITVGTRTQNDILLNAITSLET
jgi:histidinol-phosphate aminotransferase